jgi:Sugar (and other) transporter
VIGQRPTGESETPRGRRFPFAPELAAVSANRPASSDDRNATRAWEAPTESGMDLTSEQKKTIAAAFLGWMLDAFDFFLLTFLLRDIAKEFGVEAPAVACALFLTLAMRFVGAFIFGRLGDRWGRKPALMLDILCYSILGAFAAFSPNLTI